MRSAAVAQHVTVWNTETKCHHVGIGQHGKNNYSDNREVGYAPSSKRYAQTWGNNRVSNSRRHSVKGRNDMVGGLNQLYEYTLAAQRKLLIAFGMNKTYVITRSTLAYTAVRESHSLAC